MKKHLPHWNFRELELEYDDSSILNNFIFGSFSHVSIWGARLTV